MYGYRRMLSGVIRLLNFFVRKIVFVSFMSIAFQSQILGPWISFRYDFFMMEQALNPIRQWLITFIIFILVLNQCIMQAGHHVTPRVYRWFDVSLSPLAICRVYSSTEKSYSVVVKALVKHQLYICMFNEICKCFLQQQCLTIHLQRAANSLENILNYLGTSMGLLANSSIRYNTFLALLISLSGKRCIVWLSPPVIW